MALNPGWGFVIWKIIMDLIDRARKKKPKGEEEKK